LNPVLGALAALLLTELGLVLLSVSVKKVLVGKWGTDHTAPFWSLRHFAYFFSQDCFFVWCREPLRFFAGTTIANSILGMFGTKIGSRTIIAQPMQCFDWNAVNFGNDCYIDGFLQLHTFEDMTLKVKRTHIQDGCTVNVGATVMSGAVIAPGSNLLPLSLVLKEFRMPTATYEGSPAEPVGGSFNSSQGSDPTLDFEVPLDETNAEQSGLVDRTDWLKVAAIILVTIDHFGYFFVDNDRWWSVFGRMAAPSFFFLMGYAQTRKIPVRWIFIGIFPHSARQLEQRLEMGRSEHTVELCNCPARASLCSDTFGEIRLDSFCRCSCRTLRVATGRCEVVRLRSGRMVVGAVRPFSADVRRRQIA
jgi:hypothetical protein